MTPPDGFKPHFRKSSITNPWEPLYSRILENGAQLCLLASEAHVNSRGFVHGGLIATLSDNIMGIACHTALQDSSGLVTVNLTTDFLSSGQLGEWILFDAHVVKCGRKLSFANCEISANERPIARAQAIFSATESRTRTSSDA